MQAAVRLDGRVPFSDAMLELERLAKPLRGKHGCLDASIEGAGEEELGARQGVGRRAEKASELFGLLL